MNFDDYMKKIQYISSILEKNEYADKAKAAADGRG